MLKRIAIILVAVLVLAGLYVWRQLAPPEPLRASSSAFTVTDVTVINPGSSRRQGITLSVADGVITGFGQRRDSESDVFEDYKGMYVLPGLIDLHTHLPPDNALKLSQHFALLYLAHGVTSVRDAGDPDGTAVPAAREGILKGRFPGPRIFACGPFVAGGKARWANTVVLKNPKDADAAIAKIKQAGFDCIKAYDELSLETLAAVKSAAKRHGLPVIGHVPTDLSYEVALVPNVQHYFGVPPPESLGRDHVLNRASDWQAVDEQRFNRIVEATVMSGIVNTPTLVATQRLLLYKNYRKTRTEPDVALLPRLYRDVVWHPQQGLPFYRDIGSEELRKIRKAFDKKIELTRRLYAAGAELQIGTDVQQPFVVPGASVHQEMRLFTEASIPVQQVWTIATRKAGKALGVDKLGTVQAGAPADFLIFERDPSGDLNALDSLQAVVADGRLYKKSDIDAAIEASRSHFESAVVDRISVTAARMLLKRTLKRSY